MAKRYTAEEIKEKNFKRITGMDKKEYGKYIANEVLKRRATQPTQPQTQSFVTPYNADKTAVKAPEYEFTAEKPKAELNYNSFGVSSIANPEEYNTSKKEYMSAVSDATKRAIADVKAKENVEFSKPFDPKSTSSMVHMVHPIKDAVETDQAKILENYVEHKTTNEADRKFNPESYKKIQLDTSLKKPEYGTAVKNAIDNADIIDVIQAIEETGDTDRLKIVENMDGKQLKTYSYLVKNDPKAAESYFQAVTNDVKSRIAKDEYENMKVYAKYHPVGGAVGNISASLFTPLSYVGEAINQISGNDEPLPEYSDWNRAARTVQATQQGLTEDKDPVSAFLINTGLSIGQNLVRLPIAALGGPAGQVASLVSMASSAAGQTVYEAVQRGATGEQALLLGTVAGTIEGLTEKLSLDELLSLGKNSVKIFSKEAAKSILGQIASEGGEELVAEVSNIIADSLIMGDKSEIKQMYNSYLESGQSEKDAAINTLMQTALNIGLAGLGGALSGGVLGGGGVVVGSVTNNLGSAKTADSVGVENLIEEGKTYGKDTNAYKLAQRAESKIKGGKNLSAYAKGQLLNENEIAKDEEIKKAKAEIEKLKKEEAAKPTVQPKRSESKNDFTFEKAEAPKPLSKNIHSFETSADVRYNALGKNGKIGYDKLVREADSDLDIESFARDFERAYILGHSGLTESQVRQYMGEDYFKENSRLQAYYNGSKDATEEIEALRKSIKQKGIPLAQKGKGLVSNDISNSLNEKSFNLWDKVAKQLNVKIELVNEIDGNKYVEGKYNNGVIQIKATPDSSPMPSLMAHEITHRIKETAPEMYKAFKTEVSTALGKDFESEFAEVAERYRMTGEKTDSEIEEELVAEYAAQLFEDESLFEEIAERNQPLAQRLINAIKEFINKIKAAFGKGTSAEIKKLDSIQEAWAKAYDSAVKSAKTARNKAETEGTSVKLALRKDITEMNETELREEVSRISKENEALQKFIREGAAVPTADETKEFARTLIKKYNSSYDVLTLSEHLTNRFRELSTGRNKKNQTLSPKEIENNILRTASLVIDKIKPSVDKIAYEEYSALRKAIRTTPIKISQNDIFDFGSKEDFAEFRKQNFGRLPNMKVVGENKGNVDETYQMFSEEYPEFFPADITAASEQLQLMAGIFEVISPQEIKTTEKEKKEYINSFVNDIYDFSVIYQHENNPRTPLKIAEEKRKIQFEKQRKAQQNKSKEELAKIQDYAESRFAEIDSIVFSAEKKANERIIEAEKEAEEILTKANFSAGKTTIEANQIKALAEIQANNLIQDAKTQIKDEIKKVKDKIYEKQRIQKENKSKTPIEKSLGSAYSFLEKKGEKFSYDEIMTYLEDKFVSRLRVYTGDKTPSDLSTMAVIKKFLDDRIDENRDSTLWSEESNNYKYINENGKKEFDVEAKTRDSVLEEIEFVQRVLRDIEMSKKEQLQNVAKKAIEDIESAQGVKKGAISEFKAKVLYQALDPLSMFNRFFGYNESSDYFYDMLESSENKSRLLKRQGEDFFKDLFERRKEFHEFKTKRITLKVGKDFTSRNDIKEIEVTPDLLSAIYLHSLNADNMKSVEYDNKRYTGLVIPELKDYIKQGLSYSKRRDDFTVNFSKEQIERLYNEKLNDYAKDFINRYRLYTKTFTTPELNAASMDAFGTVIATVDEYFPMRRQLGFAGSQQARFFEENGKVKTLKNTGSLKERVKNAASPIYLESLTNVIEEQNITVSQYAGKIGAITRINKITNAPIIEYDKEGNLLSHKNFWNSLDKKFKNFGSPWLNNLLNDFQGNNRVKRVSMAKLRSNYATSILALNLSSSMVQHTALYKGIAELGVNPFERPKGTLLKLKDIAKYTARGTDRADGLINAELAEKYGGTAMFDKTKNLLMQLITRGDLDAVQGILMQSQVYVEKHNPKLELNSEEYEKEVARVFEKTINRTQTGSTVMLRPEVFRENDPVLRLATFMQSEGFKNANMWYNATENFKAKRRKYNANKTEENKKALEEAHSKYVRTCWAILLSNAASAVVLALANSLFEGDWEKYVDEDGELGLSDLGRATFKIFDDFLGSMLSSSMFFFGGLVHEGGKIIGKELISEFDPGIYQALTGYDPEREFNVANDIKYLFTESLPETETIYDTVVSVYNLIKNAESAVEIWSDKNKAALRKSAQSAAEGFGTMLGLPVKNFIKEIYAIADGVARVNPDKTVSLEMRYRILKWEKPITFVSNRQYYYDILYEAYQFADRSVYLEIKRDMLKNGFNSETIEKELKKRKK